MMRTLWNAIDWRAALAVPIAWVALLVCLVWPTALLVVVVTVSVVGLSAVVYMFAYILLDEYDCWWTRSGRFRE